MAIGWTDEQKRAIDTRNTNILLSAAAGSGKTTVLVGRIMDLIASGATSIDRMLVVTFSRAASADMRAKLSEKLQEGAGAGDEVCRTQLLLLERASFSTVHGFCSEFLRTHFESAGVDPAFRVLDAEETSKMSDEAIHEAVNEAYSENTPELKKLDFGRGAERVAELAAYLLSAMDEQPEPEKWLKEICACDKKQIAKWIEELKIDARFRIECAAAYLKCALAHPDCYATYTEPLKADIKKLQALLSEELDYDELYRSLGEFKLTSARKPGNQEKSNEFEKLRNTAKKQLAKAVLLKLPLKQALDDTEKIKPALQALGTIVLRALALYNKRKAELSGLSYSDLEHFTLRALQEDAAARELRERYDYVFVDEYQDTSRIQEEIIKRITKGNNLFMVGDVKQSIYRFRQAEPALFREKYERYSAGDGGVMLPLTANFRSQKPVLDFVNGIFERSMHGGSSEIIYDAAARLNAGIPENGRGAVVVHLMPSKISEEENDELAELKKTQLQAMLVVKRIQELREQDKTLKYRDFAVICRNKQKVLGEIADILTKEGIPAYADGSLGFYLSSEITLAVSLLKLIANGQSDAELIGVMRSPVMAVTDEELARIRINKPYGPFSDAVESYAKGEDELSNKLKRMLDVLERWRVVALGSSLGMLVQTVLEESRLYALAGAMPAGRQRQANLNSLIEKAAAYDSNISGSLTRFLNHIEKMKEKSDGDDAHLLGENDDVVRLMTAHKSKGLEFPVVFGLLMEKEFNRKRSKPVDIHRDLGIGLKYTDPQLKTRRTTLAGTAIQQRQKREDAAEEMRILYVLLTRAKERLELIGCIKSDYENKLAEWSVKQQMPDMCERYLDMIMTAMMPDGNGLCRIEVHNTIEGIQKENEEAALACDLMETAPADADNSLVKSYLWDYPHKEDIERPLKFTVTGLLRSVDSPYGGEMLIERPAFMAKTVSGMTGTERGSAFHRALECLEFTGIETIHGAELAERIEEQADRLLERNKLTQLQRDALSIKDIVRFLDSDIGRRLRVSKESHREWSFNALMRIRDILTDEEAYRSPDGEILVQGTIDCCFLENGGWVLLDYKTDRSRDKEALTERYRNQLCAYAKALEKITGREVLDIRLCLLSNGENIKIEIENKQ